METRQRWIWAGLAALGVHLVLLFCFPWRPPAAPARVYRTALRVQLFRVRSAPRPRHRRPKPVVHRIVHVPHRITARLLPPHRQGGRARGKFVPKPVHRSAAAAPRAVLRHELARPSASPVPEASAVAAPVLPAHGADAAGAGVAAHAAGAGGEGTEGAGTGQSGLGAGGGGAIPCGALDLTSLRTRTVHDLAPDGTALPQSHTEHTIAATIHFADGTAQSDAFPYPFVYRPNEDDPFDRRNRNNPNILILVQSPPPGFDRRTLSPVIRAILRGTSAEGISLFLPCSQTPIP